MKYGYPSVTWSGYQIFARNPAGEVWASYTEATDAVRADEYCRQEFPSAEGWRDHYVTNQTTNKTTSILSLED